MERVQQIQNIHGAANAAATRRHFAPASADEVWLLEDLKIWPNLAVASNGTNYLTLSYYVGSTEIATARSTASTGFTQGTVEEVTLTGSQKQLEISQTNPLTVRYAPSGSGVIFDFSIAISCERKRA